MNETPGIDRELGRLKKRLGETASGNTRQRDAINSRMDMLRERTGYQTEEKKASPDRLADLEQKLDTLQKSISTGKFVSEWILARKGATNLQFTELTVPDDASTSLLPIVSGGRTATSDTDPLAPLDLGQDDWLLMEVPTQSKTRTVRVAGGAVRNMRYIQTPIHAFQITFKANPIEADWITVVELDPCSTSAARTGNLFNPLGLVNNNYLYEESVTVNLGAPVTNTIKIDTADTTTDGTGGQTEELLTESLAFSLFRINAFAIGTTPKTQIRIFVSYDGGTTKFWIGHIDVKESDATGIAPRFAGRWTPADELNGMVMPATASIWVSTYDDATFNVTIEGSRVD